MTDYIPIFVAVIALIGSVFGIIIGYKKWKGEQLVQKFGQFDKKRKKTYKELWNHVEEFNIKVRVAEVTSEVFTKHLQELNSFLLKYGLYIDDNDRALANKYTQAIFDFQKAVRGSNIRAVNESFGLTREIPDDVIEGVSQIGIAQDYALNLRVELLNKIRQVLSGK